MADGYVDFKFGDYSELENKVRDLDTLYFCQDVGKIYKGNVDITKNFQSVSSAIYNNLTVENTLPNTFYVCRDNFKTKVQVIWNGVPVLQESYPGYITADGESAQAEKVLTTQSYVLQKINEAVSSIVGNLGNQLDAVTNSNKVVVTDGDSIANSGYIIGDGSIDETSQNANPKALATEKAAKKAAEDEAAKAVSTWSSF